MPSTPAPPERSTPTRARRAAGLAEKTVLGVIAGAAAAIGVLELVFLAGRIATWTSGPVTLVDVPLAAERDAGIPGAAFDTVTLTVAELSAGGRAALVGAGILSSLLAVGICAVVAWLCLRVFVGRPFVRSATWGIGIVSILVIAAALGAPTLLGIARAEAAAALDDPALPVFLVEIDPGPIGWGFALAVVAGAFELGQRLQRDSEGLV